MNICLPAASLEEVFKTYSSKFLRSPKKEDMQLEMQRKEHIMNSLEKSDLIISCELGNTTISLQDMLNLQGGDIIPLNSPVNNKSITVKVEGEPWFTGAIGFHKKKYAVKIDKVIKY
jgi:flagellar motor switch protein FliM